MNLNGGYAMIKHDATQQELAVAYKTKKPVLLYDENFRAHWAQINEKVIETVDEETQETIITYEYSYQLLNAIEALVDDSGNPRFIEGNGTVLEQEGVTISYCKWSLSGTHLMMVCAGNIANATEISTNTSFATFDLPDYIKNKIVPTFATIVDRKQIAFYNEDYSQQNLIVNLLKTSTIAIQTGGAFTASKDRLFRIQFDLLIDNE